VIAAAPAAAGREGAGPTGAEEVCVGAWPTTVGTLVEGALTAGTLVEGTLTPGTLTPPVLTPGTLTPGTLTEGTAIADDAPGTDTAPATALTEAPSAAPQRPVASAFTVVCRRLRRCAGMFRHRALPSDGPPANASSSEPYSLLVASTIVVRLMNKDAFALRRRGLFHGQARRRRLASMLFDLLGRLPKVRSAELDARVTSSPDQGAGVHLREGRVATERERQVEVGEQAAQDLFDALLPAEGQAPDEGAAEADGVRPER
jgi:hypothetical protein